MLGTIFHLKVEQDFMPVYYLDILIQKGIC